MRRVYCNLGVELISDITPLDIINRVKLALAREFEVEFNDDVDVIMLYHSGKCGTSYCGEECEEE